MTNKTICQLMAALALFIGIQEAVLAADDLVTVAQGIPVNEQVLRVPGDPDRPVRLQVTLLTPDGLGPFPLAVMNHDASANLKPSLEPRYRSTFLAAYFLARGYAVVLPMMRGFSRSEGRVASHGCQFDKVGIDNAKDVRAVIKFLSERTDIDSDHVVVAGQSFGGWNTLAYGTLDDPHVKGLINFAGGMKVSECSKSESAMALGAEHFGAVSKVPSIWFYGDNDAVFPTPAWQVMADRYQQAGGTVDLVAYGRFMTDSHNMLGYSEGLRIWAPKVDSFLDKIGLPNKIVNPKYLPTEFPPATNFAAIDDVDAVPYLNEEGRQAYRKFLNDPMPRVFIIAPSGATAAFNGGFDPLGRGLNACQKQVNNCRIYAVDDYVAWVRPTPAPASTQFAALDNYAAVPYLNDAGREGYQKYLTMPKPKAFVIAPDGGWTVASHGDDPLAAAMASCSKSHQDCRYYAVDDNVVWLER